MRLLCVNMGHVNNKFERKTKTGRRFPRTRNFLPPEQKPGKISRTANRTGKMLARKRTREFQPGPFCFRIFLPATRSRTARRNFSRSAGLSMSSSSRVQGGIAVVGMFYIPKTVLQTTCDKPVRRLPYSNYKGFAGSASDALTKFL